MRCRGGHGWFPVGARCRASAQDYGRLRPAALTGSPTGPASWRAVVRPTSPPPRSPKPPAFADSKPLEAELLDADSRTGFRTRDATDDPDPPRPPGSNGKRPLTGWNLSLGHPARAGPGREPPLAPASVEDIAWIPIAMTTGGAVPLSEVARCRRGTRDGTGPLRRGHRRTRRRRRGRHTGREGRPSRQGHGCAP